MLCPSPTCRHRISNAIHGAKLAARMRGKRRTFRIAGRLVAAYRLRLRENARRAHLATVKAYAASFD